MARRNYPTAWHQWFNQIAIISHGGDKNPVVVHIKGVNLHGVLIAEAINQSVTHFTTPLRCIQYSPRMYKRLLLLSQYRCAAGDMSNKRRELLGIASKPNKRSPQEVC